MKITRRLVLLLMLMVCITVGLWAADSEITGNLKLIGSTAPEFKVEAGYTVKMPFLQGEGPLFSTNNIRLKGIMGITPITGSLNFEAIMTPIAVMELSVGGVLGTGWNFDLMELQGLREWDGISDKATSASMEGVYYKGKGGAALQFDTAAIWPGDWTSVVVRTYHEINYQGFTYETSSTGGWEFETGGLHQNSFNYKGDYLVGYQMPLVINTVAIMLETYKDNIGNSLEIDGLVFDLGLVTNFKFGERINLTVIPQMTTKKSDSDTRVMSKVDFTFKRVAAMLNYAF
ncbi:hypothetical protein [Pleomorphochaeta sp. DL1XJH-081]|uniref:hypothetical protein n=1 Tax=Pleomorphochaeta sp. DL1XJH-081 TaxID=3409690 RepID=UPI003BB6DA36